MPDREAQATEVSRVRKPIIGLTGGIGSGKSSVAHHFAMLGAGVIDADALARDAIDRPDIRDRLVAMFGNEILAPDGSPARDRIAALVFDSQEQLQRLESVIHPEVHRRRAAMRRKFLDDPAIRAVVEDVPLLMEKGLDKGCDVVIFVDCPVQTRLKRLAASRGWAPGELHRREKCQLPLGLKAQQADYVIDNSVDDRISFSTEYNKDNRIEKCADSSVGESACQSQVRGILARILRKYSA